MRREARAWGARIEGLARDVEALRLRLSDSLAAWDRQLGEVATLKSIRAEPGQPPAHEQSPESSSRNDSLAPRDLDEPGDNIHDEAARYARLLVSEIELYNQDQVAQGRANRDLYSRLKPHIERSRHAFERRFSHSVTAPKDYFHEELVHTLACNDPSLLGADYPAPPE